MDAHRLSLVGLAVAWSTLGILPRLSAQEPDRSAQPSARLTGTAVVWGEVTDRAGTPLPTVTVRTQRRDRFPSVSTTTDANGRYELRQLPRMSLRVAAALPGFAGPAEGREALRSVTLEDGEVRRVDFVLVRTGGIVGRVLGPAGKAVAGAMVRVEPRGRRPSSDLVLPGGITVSTDALGAYRVADLPPGDYFVAVRAPGRAVSPTFYPGVTEPGAAGTVAVTTGADTTADVPLPNPSLFAVSGTVLDRQGRPAPGAFVELRPDAPEVPAALLAVQGASPGPDGRFRLEGVAAGRYTLIASEAPHGRCAAAPGPCGLWQKPLDVRGDVPRLTATLTDGATVRGRVVFATRPPADLSSLQVYSRPADRGGPWWRMPPVMLAPDGRFEFTRVRGAVTFMVMSAPLTGPNSAAALSKALRGAWHDPEDAEAAGPDYRLVAGRPVPVTWRVRAIRVRGREVTATGVDAGQGGTVTDVVVEVSADEPIVTGVVHDARGRPWPGALMVAIPLGPLRGTRPAREWRALGSSVQDGRYILLLEPGRWGLVALADVADPALIDDSPEGLARLRSRATVVTLRPSKTMTLDLEVVRLP